MIPDCVPVDKLRHDIPSRVLRPRWKRNQLLSVLTIIISFTRYTENKTAFLTRLSCISFWKPTSQENHARVMRYCCFKNESITHTRVFRLHNHHNHLYSYVYKA